jgi:hypothetical protein
MKIKGKSASGILKSKHEQQIGKDLMKNMGQNGEGVFGMKEMDRQAELLDDHHEAEMC